MKAWLVKCMDGIITGLCIMAAFIVGIGAAALTFSKYLIPKWRREEEAETARRVAAMKAEIEKSRAERTARTETAVAVVKQEAETAKAQDTVDLANSLIASAGEKR